MIGMIPAKCYACKNRSVHGDRSYCSTGSLLYTTEFPLINDGCDGYEKAPSLAENIFKGILTWIQLQIRIKNN